MKTRMECRSLGEQKGTYNNTNSSIRQIRQQEERTPEHSSRGTGMSGRSKSNSTSGAGSVAVGLLAGAGVGVLAGILMAPQKGEVTRRRVSDSASWIGRGITEALGSGKTKVNSWTSKGNSVQNGPYADPNRQGDRTMPNRRDNSGNREL
jgi:hypothetical protein